MVASTKIHAPRTAKHLQADDVSIEMPNDIPAEEALLGSLLIDRHALAEVKAAIPNFCAEHFYRPLHKAIYQAMLAVGSNDIISIAGYLKDRGNAEADLEVGQLVNRVVSSDYAVSAAWRVYDKARSRAQIGLGQAMMMAGMRGNLAQFDQLMEQGERLKEDYVPPPARPLKVRSMRDIMRTEYPEQRMLIEKLVQQGVVTLLAGKAKAGKSYLLLGAAFAVGEACQEAFSSPGYHGLHCEPSHVLYMALEDTERRLKNRTKKMRGELPVPEFFDVCTEAPRIDEGIIAQLELYLDAHPDCNLIIIDTLMRILPPPSRTGGYQEDYINLAGLRDLAHRRDVAILPVIHCRKADGSDVFDTIQTTMGTQAASENLIVLQRKRGEDRATLHITGNDIESEALALKWNKENCTWAILGDADEVAENEQEDHIFTALEALEHHEGNLNSISEKLKGQMVLSYVKTTLYRMSSAGKLTNTGGVFKKSENSTSETSETLKPETAETPQQRTLVDLSSGKEYTEPLAEEVSECQSFRVSEVSKVDFSAEQEHAEGSIGAETLVDPDALDPVAALIQEALREEVTTLWEQRKWQQVPVEGHLRGGAHFSAMKVIENATLGFLQALLTALLALGGA